MGPIAPPTPPKPGDPNQRRPKDGRRGGGGGRALTSRVHLWREEAAGTAGGLFRLLGVREGGRSAPLRPFGRELHRTRPVALRIATCSRLPECSSSERTRRHPAHAR